MPTTTEHQPHHRESTAHRSAPGLTSGSRHAAAALAVLLLAVVAYLNCLAGEFVLDDQAFYVNNPSLTANHDVSRFFTSSVWEHSILARQSDPLYRPVFMLAMWVNQSLFGSSTIAHHAFSILLHALASLMLLQLLRRLLPNAGTLPPLAGALLFAAHPVHVEAVSWISAFGHPLATLLLLGALLCHLRHGESGKPWPLALSLGLFGLALLSMEVAIAFPLIVTCYEYLDHRRLLTLRNVAPWVLLLCYVVLRTAVLAQAVPLDLTSAAPWKTAANFAGAYLDQLLVPWPQPFYLSTPEHGISLSAHGVATIIIGATLAFALVRRNLPDRRVLLFGICWILFSLTAPVLAALNPHPMFAVRSLYLASAGVSILIAWFLTHCRQVKLPAALFVGLLVTTALATTVLATRSWRTELAIVEKVLATAPGNDAAAVKAADFYDAGGKFELAEKTLLAALPHAPTTSARAILHNRLGMLYGTHNLFDKSAGQYRETLQFDPANSPALVGLGNIALLRNDYRTAISRYLAAIEADPNNREAYFNASLAYRRLGDNVLADDYLRKAR